MRVRLSLADCRVEKEYVKKGVHLGSFKDFLDKSKTGSGVMRTSLAVTRKLHVFP